MGWYHGSDRKRASKREAIVDESAAETENLFFPDSAVVGRIVCGGVLLQRQAGPHDRLSDRLEPAADCGGRYLLGFLLGAAISGRIDRIRLKNLSRRWQTWLALALWLAFVWKVYFPFLYRYEVSPIGYFISRGFALGIPIPFLFSNGDAEHPE